MQRLSSLLIGFGLGIIGMSLLYDPWAEERFERTIRETARLDNQFLNQVDMYIQTRLFIGYMIVACAFVIMNRLGLLYIIVIPSLIIYGAIHNNHILYKSERFGGGQIITGGLFIFAIIGAILDGLIKPKKVAKIEQQQVKSKAE